MHGRWHSRNARHARTEAAVVAAVMAAFGAGMARAEIATTPTTEPADLSAALHPVGLKVTSVDVLHGAQLQFGTYTQFSLSPVSMQDGIVLGSGDISSLGPLAEAQWPGYDPASPPARVVNAMYSGATPEFLDYGLQTGAIANFSTAEDVAVLAITFELPVGSNVKFDYVFGSVEYPYWTSLFTDAFLVFLDGTAPEDQVCFDANGAAIQVGQSFASLVTTADRNTAFSNPHGLIRSLTTTTPLLGEGEHVLYIEVGDVNDMILDSAVFLTNLRAEPGVPGTKPTGCEADFDGDDAIGASDLAALLGSWGTNSPLDLNGDDVINAADLSLLLSTWGPCT